MRSFFKIFFASLLALVLFSVMAIFIFIGFISGLATPEKVKTGAKAVLVVDLAMPYPEIGMINPFAALGDKEDYNVPSLYDAIRMIRYAKTDSSVKGIYIKCGTNGNGLAASGDSGTGGGWFAGWLSAFGSHSLMSSSHWRAFFASST